MKECIMSAKKRVSAIFLSALFGIFILATPGRAQINLATLEGTVTDPSGAVIVGAVVEARNVETEIPRSTKTNGAGVYRIPGLGPGIYAVTFTRDGFKSLKYDSVELYVGQTQTLDARLEIGATTSQVEVQDDPVAFEKTSAEVGGIIQRDQILELPSNGRNWATLLLLVPGAQDDGGGDQRSIRFSGRGRDDNNYTLDGIDATGIQEQAQKSEVRLQISQESISEYRVETALYTAEHGAGAGGQVDVVSKTGTNNFHGSVFEYFRNNIFDARSFLDGPKVPPFRLNQYGVSVGGPIIKDRTFFFATWEGLRQARDFTGHAFVPSAAFKTAVNATSPALDVFMNAFPKGQASTADPNVDTFTGLAHATVTEDSWLVRIDHKFTDKTNLYFRATRDIAFADTPNGNLMDRNAIQSNPANLLIALQHAFSPTLFNEARFGINRSPFRNPQIGVVPVTYTIPGQGTATGINFDTSGIFETLNDNVTDVEVGTTFSYIDNLTWTRGRHTFKTGLEVRRIELNQGKTADTTISFADQASIIANTATDISVQGPWCCHGLRRTFVMPYFQDEFKFRPNLTINAGLRWEYYSVINEAHGRERVFDLERCHGICPTGTPAYFPNYLNFDPRFSLAWSPDRLHGKTVIRTGFGIYHGAAQNDDENQPLESDTFRTVVNPPAGMSFPIDPLLASATFAPSTPRAIERSRRDLYVEQWGLSIQHSLPWDFLLSTGYSGSHGVRLFARSYVNTCADLIVNNGNCVRPLDAFFPAGQDPFGLVDIKSDTGTSSYNALLVTLQRNFRNGLEFQANYSWAKSINDGSVGGGEANAVQNAACRACDRGPSVFDVRHNFVVSAIYELPIGPGKTYWNSGGAMGKVLEGWSLNTLAVAHTGHPLTVIFSPSTDTLGNSIAPLDGNSQPNLRPDLVPGVSVVPANQNTNNWINPAAFVEPPCTGACQNAGGVGALAGPFATSAYTRWGNAGNGIVRAPSIWQADFALDKKTKLTERFNLEFQAQFFNIFNHTQLADPNLDINGSGFGVITTDVHGNLNSDHFNTSNTGTGLPRQMQFSLRLNF
jgi:hypothetical protein